MYNGFYYFADFRNFKSIIENGIISRNSIIKSNFNFFDFSNSEVQTRRHFREFYINGIKYWIHDFVPLYFVPKTPTLYAIKDMQDKLFFIEINSAKLLENKKYFLTDGNAASSNTSFFENTEEDEKKISWEVIKADYWNNFEDGARKRNAEILIYDRIEPKYFNRIIINNKEVSDFLHEILIKKGLDKDFQIDIPSKISDFFFL